MLEFRIQSTLLQSEVKLAPLYSTKMAGRKFNVITYSAWRILAVSRKHDFLIAQIWSRGIRNLA